MSTSACYDFAVCNPRNSSRKATPYTVAGRAAVAGLVLGCVWTVYANVLGAGIYPALSSANFDAPVIKRPPAFAAGNSHPVAKNVVAALAEPAVSLAATAWAVTPLMFNDRFAAAAPQAEAPKSAAVPQQAEAPQPQQVSPPSPAVQIVESVPLPAPRPSALRMFASREIAKAKAAIL